MSRTPSPSSRQESTRPRKAPTREHPRPREFIPWKEAKRLYKRGWTYARIAGHFDCKPATIANGLKRRGISSRPPSPRSASPKLYMYWRRLRAGCTDPKAKSWAKYGGRGLRLCEAWQSFTGFHAWATTNGYKPALRLHVSEGRKLVGPESCSWVKASEVAAKTVRPRWTLRAFGEDKGTHEWARDPRCVVKVDVLRDRLRRGWPLEAAIRTPLGVVFTGQRVRRKKREHTVQQRIDWSEAEQLYREGTNFSALARRYGVSAATIGEGFRARELPRLATGLDPTSRPLRKSWTRMKDRCSNPTYAYYAGKGIKVCGEWENSFEAFSTWARANGYKLGLSLARIDHDGGYSPKNCRWTTRAEATRASSRAHRDAVRPPRWTVTAFGETKGPTEWSRDPRCNVTKGALFGRLHAGWEQEKAISLPALQEVERDPVRKITAFGQTKGLLAWAQDRRCKVTASGLLQRIRRGVEPEVAIRTAAYRLS